MTYDLNENQSITYIGGFREEYEAKIESQSYYKDVRPYEKGAEQCMFQNQ